MKREPKIKGYDWSGLVIVGGIFVLVSGVLPYGTRGGPFVMEQLTVPGSVLLGLIIVVVGIIPSMAKRWGSRAGMVGGAVPSLALGGLDIWLRIDNLSMLTGESASVGFGLWLALAGGIAVVLGAVGALIQAARARPSEVSGEVAPPPPPPTEVPPPAPPAPKATHRVPAGGMPATARPDPTAEVITTLDGGLPVQVLEIRGDWAHVRAENGWEGWVDARKLESVEPSIA